MYVVNDGRYYGELGEYTDYKDFYVGDIIHVKEKSNNSEVANLMIVYSSIDSMYSALGLLYLDIKDFEKDYEITKVMSYIEVGEENINNIAYFDGFELRKEEY